MHSPKIHTIDLNFQGIPGAIGVFFIPFNGGGALVECGPGSTLPSLINGLEQFNISPPDISDVLLTHIHLDHAGSAGWWANQGSRIHVHHIGAPHMHNPEKLLASAGRIYGELMDKLWGDFLPVPEHKLNILYDGDELTLGDLTICAIDTPGHANHHMSYLLGETCFSGDVGGVHLQGTKAIRLPTVPPEFDPELWSQSLQKFHNEKISAFATTHFGIHKDASWHLGELEKFLDEIIDWMDKIMPLAPTKEELRKEYSGWIEKRSSIANLSREKKKAFELAISSQMSADGIFRYWNKKHSVTI